MVMSFNTVNEEGEGEKMKGGVFLGKNGHWDKEIRSGSATSVQR